MRCNDISFSSTAIIVFAKKTHTQQQLKSISLISVVFHAVYIGHLHIKEKKKHAYRRNTFENNYEHFLVLTKEMNDKSSPTYMKQS